MTRRRPFKVRAWSFEWFDYVGGSFGSRETAEARGVLYVKDGLIKVEVWENDERGYMVRGPWRIRAEDPA